MLVGELRYYKGKYPCEILHTAFPKALVLWLCNCKEVGNKKVGYKEVFFFGMDIICSMRLLKKEERRK